MAHPPTAGGLRRRSIALLAAILLAGALPGCRTAEPRPSFPSVPIPEFLVRKSPVASVSLAGLEPYRAPSLISEPCPEDPFRRLESFDAGHGRSLVIYAAADGNLCVGLDLSGDGKGQVKRLLILGDVEYQVSPFRGLFGRDGLSIRYTPPASDSSSIPEEHMDYIYINEAGEPSLLARCFLRNFQSAAVLDLDGDGRTELCTPRQLFFSRDGVVHEADLKELLEEVCPWMEVWSGDAWESDGNYLPLSGFYPEPSPILWIRYVLFDGEALWLYDDHKPYTDHMVEGADNGVPAGVIDAARRCAEGIYTASGSSSLPEEPGWENDLWPDPVAWDDWRVESFRGPYVYSHGDLTVEAWAFNYELHTPTPEEVVLAGGRYVTEEGWVSPGYPGCDWLFFLREGEERTLLWRETLLEDPESEDMRELVAARLEALDPGSFPP